MAGLLGLCSKEAGTEMDTWRQQFRDGDRETCDKEWKKRQRRKARGTGRKGEGDVSVCRKKEVSEGTGDSF